MLLFSGIKITNIEIKAGKQVSILESRSCQIMGGPAGPRLLDQLEALEQAHDLEDAQDLDDAQHALVPDRVHVRALKACLEKLAVQQTPDELKKYNRFSKRPLIPPTFWAHGL